MKGAWRAACVVTLAACSAHASPDKPYDPHPPPTLPWMLAQLVPSPEIGVGGLRVAGGMRWQLTPLLYSFGMYRKLSPWRAFVVEPLTRQSGSVELFFSPEYLSAPGGGDEWLARMGVHATFPLLERGEKLAFTLGAGAHLGAETGAVFEAGVSVFAGVAGLFFSYAPRLTIAPATLMLRVRIF
ncbi:MAG TPA: hypothetical protein VLM85_06280 [Polyangiaceae bacterium]|nr:hypothetical protein [Polyangiaceae bacterium]